MSFAGGEADAALSAAFWWYSFDSVHQSTGRLREALEHGSEELQDFVVVSLPAPRP